MGDETGKRQVIGRYPVLGGNQARAIGQG
jgi:hypothetical protein